MEGLTSEKRIELLKSFLVNFDKKNDTEKFARLLTIPKLISTFEVKEDELLAVYDAVGFKFINRLLRSEQVPENCSLHSFKSISLSILKGFSCIPTLAEDSNMTKNIPVFNKIITDFMSDDELCMEEEVKNVISDCLEIMVNIAKTTNGCECLIYNETLSVLGICISNLFYGWSKAFDVLKILLKHPSFLSSKAGHQKFPHFLMLATQKVFSNPPLPEVFEVLKHLSEILDCIDKDFLEVINFEMFWPVFIEGLHGMLRSKLNVEQRQLGVDASCKVISLLGVEWFLKEKKFEEFHFLAFHLAAVELHLSFEATADQKDADKLGLYTTCCKIVELSIQHCASLNPNADHSKEEKLRELIFELISSVLQFFERFSSGAVEREDVTPYCIVLLRLVCAFISFEEFALEEDILFAMPAFINIYNALFKQLLEDEAESLKPRTCECRVQNSKQKMKQITAAICRTSLDETSEVEVGKEETAHHSSCSDLHILDLFLPGLESLTHLNEAREVVLENGALEMLLGYFCSLCRKHVTDDGDDEENIMAALNRLCNIFCNFVYPAEESCQEFIFQDICYSLIHVLLNPDYKFLQGNEHLELMLSLQTLCAILLHKTDIHSEIDSACLKKLAELITSTIKKTKTKKCYPTCVKLLKKELKNCFAKSPLLEELSKP